MRLWKSCGKHVDIAVDRLRVLVIHISIPKLFHMFSTGFAQGFFLNFSTI